MAALPGFCEVLFLRLVCRFDSENERVSRSVVLTVADLWVLKEGDKTTKGKLWCKGTWGCRGRSERFRSDGLFIGKQSAATLLRKSCSRRIYRSFDILHGDDCHQR